jgi:O-antigen ligase
LIRFESDSGSPLLRAARWCAFGSAASIVCSIALSEALLAISLATLLMSGARLRLPRIWLPITLWMLATALSMAFSGQPAAGLPAIRKFYLFLELLVLFSTFDLIWVRRLFWSWAFLCATSALWACVQFMHRISEARELQRPFYAFYMADHRVTGFMSHWNTFSAQMMFLILFVVAFLIFAANVRTPWSWVAAACGAVATVGMVLGFTRIIIFMAFPVAVLYLVWWWRRWLVAVLPLAALGVILISPAPLKERFESIFHPRKNVDSNDFRRVTFRTGLEMIKAHPFFGVGPERAGQQGGVFDQYVPKDIPRPLPDGWYGHLHSLYIHYAAERGIPAMLVLVWLLAQMAWDFWRGRRKLVGRSDAQFALQAALAVIIGVVLEGFFEVNLGISAVLGMFLAVVACGYVALEKANA